MQDNYGPQVFGYYMTIDPDSCTGYNIFLIQNSHGIHNEHIQQSFPVERERKKNISLTLQLLLCA